jgi:hypothetical protein
MPTPNRIQDCSLQSGTEPARLAPALENACITNPGSLTLGLIGLVVTHWTTLLRGGPLCEVSPTKLFTVVAEWAMNLRLSLTQGATAFEAAMEGLAKELGRVRKQTTSRKKPSTRQNMQSPGVAA